MKRHALLLLSILFLMSGCFSMPSFGPSKDELKKEVSALKQQLDSTAATLKASLETIANASQLIYGLNAELATNKALTQSASDDVEAIAATNRIQPGTTRKDAVIQNHAAEAAASLPRPSDAAKIEAATRLEMDELRTTNAQLLAQHNSELATSAHLQKQLADIQTTNTQQASELTETKAKLKASEEKNQSLTSQLSKAISDGKDSVIQTISEFKYWIGGIFIFVGILLTVFGSVLGNVFLSTKGVALAVFAGLGMLIPTTWYLAGLGLALVVILVYAFYHWHKEKSIADNCVGIIEETKAAIPPEAKEKMKAIMASYWGTSEKQVAKADAWINAKLKQLNF